MWGMKLALGQINTIIGDFEGNAEKIITTARTAADKGADLVVFPELCICGYPPMDLLDYDDFIARNISGLERIASRLPEGIATVLGYVDRNTSGPGKSLRDCVALVSGGSIIHRQNKTYLPTYDVFDEARYFQPADEWNIVEICGRRIGIAVCEDIWREEENRPGTGRVSPVMKLAEQGIDLLIVPSASPFYSGKNETRHEIVSDIVSRYGIAVAYCNMTGGNDSIIFDGNSFVMNPSGLVTAASAFREDLIFADPFTDSAGASFHAVDTRGELAQALSFGLAEYTGRCGFSRVHLGLSGGIDSAVCTCIAVDALGPDNVTVLAMPSRFSSKESMEDARELAGLLGIRLEVLPIEQIYASSLATLGDLFEGLESDVTEENIQARIRGMLLMAWSNKFHSLLLETGNKSELATGYCTLYGDMCGGIAPIGDLFKTEVYELARFYNRHRHIIPERILTKAPSAELRPGQRDEDSLPSYPVLDDILRHYLLENRTRAEIVEMGYEADTVVNVLGLVARSEYKRLQAPPVLKVSPRAFGNGRRIPVARFVYEV